MILMDFFHAKILFYVTDIFSTGIVRFGLWFLTLAVLVVIWLLLRHLPEPWFPISVGFIAALSFSIIIGWYRAFPAVLLTAFTAGTVVTFGFLSLHAWRKILNHHLFGRFFGSVFAISVGIAEALWPWPYLIWLGRSLPRVDQFLEIHDSRFVRELCALAVGAGIFALLLPFPPLAQLSTNLLMSNQVTIAYGTDFSYHSKYDVSDLSVDTKRRLVLLCGDSQISVQVIAGFDSFYLQNDTRIVNYGNEFCEFPNTKGALVSVDQKSKELIWSDKDYHLITGRLPLPNLPPGETFLSENNTYGLMVAASENVKKRGDGPEIRIVDLVENRIIREFHAEVGYMISHPTLPIFYVNHFKYDLGVRAIDMLTGEVIATSEKFGQSDWMVIDLNRNEVLATSPVHGQIQRFDAETLAQKEPISTVFGARGLAVDHKRDILLVSSQLTNELDVIDLKTRKSIRRYHLGPWLRDVALGYNDGTAFAASRYAVYEVHYLE